MAVYKVPQDVEADDKLIGPFSFRQFVFFLVMVGFIYVGFLLSRVNIFMTGLPLPIVVLLAALAFPWKKDQPTEVYLTALVNFWLKPRKHIWNQEGHIEHVRITAPKKIDHQYSDGLTGRQVKSRLKNLASTLDSRGWAAKHTSFQAITNTQYQQPTQQDTPQSDRLMMPTVIQPAVQDPSFAVTVEDDVMDYENNPIARNLDALVTKSAEEHKALLKQQMLQAASTSREDPTPSDSLDQTKVNFDPYPQMQQTVIAPQSKTPVVENSQITTPNPVNSKAQSAIIDLVNNSDLNVSTIARQADQAMQNGDTIELH